MLFHRRVRKEAFLFFLFCFSEDNVIDACRTIGLKVTAFSYLYLPNDVHVGEKKFSFTLQESTNWSKN